MDIRVLGPIEIRWGDTSSRLTAPKECALLAALLASPNEPVPTARLIDALWPGDPPPSASHNLRLYVTRLRRRLGDGDRVARLERGYALAVRPEEVDALRFERALDRARAGGGPADAAGVAALYREALEPWRGSAFEGADLGGGAGRDYAVRLDELRAAAIEEWVDVELDLGRHRALIGELRALTAAHPLRERLHAQLMLALYRSGRQAEALDAYQAARRVIVAELGLEPGPELRGLESAILAGDPALDHVPGRADPVRSAPVRSGRASRLRKVAAALVVALAVAVYASRSGARGLTPAPAAATPAGPAGPAGPAVPATPAPGAAGGDGVLTVGTLLPRTGLLYFIGSSTGNGARLAVEDVNAAGGVLGRPVRLLEADSGDTSPDIATSQAAGLVERGVDLVVGPASSTLSLRVLDEVTDAGVTMISPAATAGELTDAYDQGMYFRTVAADTLQGELLGRLAAEEGNRTAMIVTLDDAYGDDVSGGARRALAAHGVKVLDRLVYRPGTRDFARYAARVAEARPDALVMIGFEETVPLIRELARRGLTARDQNWYLTDANLVQYADRVPAGVLAGAQGTLAGSDPAGAFAARMRRADPQHDDLGYAAEAYDAVVLGALAAEAAHSDLGQSIAARLAEVSSGGRRCTSYRDCAALVRAGVDIDYDGLSGRIEFDSNGDVREGSFGVYRYDESNHYERVATRTVGHP
ncbi:ABC transporter substrate-binding protein [Nonomuraea roseoviolacea]|uniref:ABC-type branched-subunit amino acid transport system substrate-binding protein/DNA-binding SARP family transcriptional activator n=1 Tax=Nonomuraea roseoviolacea subsp. carminata TaxID=160689 RepID=A0ABT1JQN8_9ACTN|nr:ABC transporter substrate-binding protein [Nonomuraea roseoviolacea]MCP2344043.1 ABC-type branched-subunit amino acid transport system substrate-binding protein/DNA-binding SARP family transcriptional activator [Nonomuraea roseoviolacea subsp. carminata]